MDSATESRLMAVRQPHRNAVLSRHWPRPTADCRSALQHWFNCRSSAAVGIKFNGAIITEWHQQVEGKADVSCEVTYCYIIA